MAAVTYNIDTLENIFKRREHITFEDTLDNSNINISYIKGTELTAANTLSIFPRHDSLIENKETVNKDYEIIYVPEYDLSSPLTTPPIMAYHSTVLLDFTSIFATRDGEYANTNDIPLFYRHILDVEKLPRVGVSGGYFDSTIHSSAELLDIKILDKNYQEVNVKDKYIDWTRGYFYSNLINKINKSTLEYEIYYVQYQVKISGIKYDFIELLNSIKTIARRNELQGYEDFDDLWNYFKLDINVNFNLTIILQFEYYLYDPYPNKIKQKYLGIRTSEKQVIKLLSPTNEKKESSWRIFMRNGGFWNAGLLYTFNSLFEDTGVRDLIDKECHFLSKNQLVLPSYYGLFPMQFNNDGTYIPDEITPDEDTQIEILINDKNDNGLAAFTTKASLTGTTASNNQIFQTWNNIDKVGIRSIDCYNGIIDIEGLELDPSYKIYITAETYRVESDLVYPSYDDGTTLLADLLEHNPLLDDQNINNKIVYVVLGYNDLGVQLSDYLVVNKEDRVIYASDNLGEFILDNNTQLIPDNSNIKVIYRNKELYYSHIPSYLSSENKVVFLDMYTDLLSSTNWKFLILGEVTTRPPTCVSDLEKFDIRVRNEFVQESQVDDLIEEFPEISNYTDIGFFDGKPYPHNNSLYVEIPADLHENFGGNFSSTEIKEIISNHIALGNYPVIRYHAIDIKLSSIEITNNTIDLAWTAYGETTSIRYNIYQSNSTEGPWTQLNGSPFTDTSYNVTSLLEGTTYYFNIEPVYQNDDLEWVKVNKESPQIFGISTSK
jgi:hypothetical protein